jgi:hypothetical protein
MGLAGIAAQVGQAYSIASALDANLQPSPGNTTTAVNLLVVMKNQVVGLIRSLRVDEQFNYQQARALGLPISAAFVPGVYTASGTVSRAFLLGQTFEQALGGGIRPVVGKSLVSADFTSFYFNIVEVDNNGNPLATRHDCVMSSISRAYEIDQVIIMEDCNLLIRWSD